MRMCSNCFSIDFGTYLHTSYNALNEKIPLYIALITNYVFPTIKITKKSNNLRTYLSYTQFSKKIDGNFKSKFDWFCT